MSDEEYAAMDPGPTERLIELHQRAYVLHESSVIWFNMRSLLKMLRNIKAAKAELAIP